MDSSLLLDLKAEPWRFDYFALLRHLERVHDNQPRIGDSATLRDEASKLQRHMVPASIVVLEVIMILCLAWLVIPSGLTGQTVGKRLQKIRVVRVDGSPGHGIERL